MPRNLPTPLIALSALCLAFNLLLSGIVLASSVRIIVEDWDTTPPLPDQVRGWGNRLGEAQLESGLGTGSYARAPLEFIIPNALWRPWQPDPSDWTSSAQVGNKNYRALGAAQVRYIARHDFVPSILQLNRVETSLVFFSSKAVPDPNFPGSMVWPRVWKETEDKMDLGQGWHEFVIDIPSRSAALPDGWQAYPDLPETWQSVITDVDRVGVVFGRYGFTIGGVIYGWDNALDNFSVEFRAPNVASVNSLDGLGMALLAGLMLIVIFLADARMTLKGPKTRDTHDF